jgi:hypothetical protein
MSKPLTALVTSILLGVSYGALAGDGACNHNKEKDANHVSLTEGSSRMVASGPTGAGTGDTYDNSGTTGTGANTSNTGDTGGTGASGGTGSTDMDSDVDTLGNDASGTGTGTGADTVDNDAVGSGTSGAGTTSGGM